MPPRPLVLVADDEPSLRDLACRILEFGGFRVLTAADGWEAVARCEEHPGVRAVLLDLRMPGPGPARTAAGLRAAAPRARVVVSSGLTADYAADLDLGDAAFLAKPYSAGELLAAVQAAVAGTPVGV